MDIKERIIYLQVSSGIEVQILHLLAVTITCPKVMLPLHLSKNLIRNNERTPKSIIATSTCCNKKCSTKTMLNIDIKKKITDEAHIYLLMR